jgi:hypothetical protein
VPERKGDEMLFRDQDSVAERALVVLCLAGIASAIGLFVAHGVDVDGVPGFTWLTAILLLGASLAVGLWLRPTRPALAYVFILVGSAAPVVAWYHLWYWYPLTVAIAVLALLTMPRMHSSVAAS